MRTIDDEAVFLINKIIRPDIPISGEMTGLKYTYNNR